MLGNVWKNAIKISKLSALKREKLWGSLFETNGWRPLQFDRILKAQNGLECKYAFTHIPHYLNNHKVCHDKIK